MGAGRWEGAALPVLAQQALPGWELRRWPQGHPAPPALGLLATRQATRRQQQQQQQGVAARGAGRVPTQASHLRWRLLLLSPCRLLALLPRLPPCCCCLRLGGLSRLTLPPLQGRGLRQHVDQGGISLQMRGRDE